MSDRETEIEALAAEFHAVYQEEAHRQGDVRHAEAYEALPENIKEFDRVLARHVFSLLDAERARAERAETARDWEKIEHDKARNDWLAMCDRLNGLHRVLARALVHTRPPEDAPIIDYGNGIEAEPWAWLATIVSEALADYPSFEYERWEGELAKAASAETRVVIAQNMTDIAEKRAERAKAEINHALLLIAEERKYRRGILNITMEGVERDLLAAKEALAAGRGPSNG